MALTEEQREIALLPCPFCGGKAKKSLSMLSEVFAYANEMVIQCKSCGCSRSARGDSGKGGYADNSTVEKRAIEAWNARTKPPIAPPASEQKPVAEIVPMTKEQIWEAFQNNGFGKARALTYSDAHSFSKFRQGMRAAEAHHSKHADPQPDYKSQRDALLGLLDSIGDDGNYHLLGSDIRVQIFDAIASMKGGE